MLTLSNNLALSRCPHCSVAKPNLGLLSAHETHDHAGMNLKLWRVYVCSHCGGLVSAFCRPNSSSSVVAFYPSSLKVDGEIPERPRSYLQQAIDSISAPAGSVMLCASAVDSMLKAKGFGTGSLYSRIKAAVDAHVLTAEMADWAHAVRLDANDQRHADEEATLPSQQDAERAIDFTVALAQFLFVLPAKIAKGIAASS